jgi:hypothetical protein
MIKFILNTMVNMMLDISVAFGMCHYMLPSQVASIPVIERVNVRTGWVQDVNKAVSNRQIEVYPANTHPGIFYIPANLQPGDRVLLDPANAIKMQVTSYKGEGVSPEKKPTTLETTTDLWVPFVAFRDKSQEKWFGLMPAQNVAALQRDQGRRDLSVDELLAYRGGKGLTLLYIVCPKDRNTIATLRIKHDGEWVRGEDGEIIAFKVLVRSRREQKRPEEMSNRLVPSNDTPQGIYGLWGTMLSSDPLFAGVPRIDLDMFMPPINGYPYEFFAYVLQQILPESAWQDGWVHELPLAYAMGRSAMRIHDNSRAAHTVSFYQEPETGRWFHPTAGCVNMGESMEKLLALLIDLGVLDGQYDKRMLTHVSGLPTSWNVAKSVGRAFVIVKDLE